MGDFVSLLAALPAGQISFAAIVSFVIISIIKGWLIPGQTYDKNVTNLKEQVKDWKDAYNKTSDQVDELRESARTMDHFIRSLPQARLDPPERAKNEPRDGD